MIATPGRLIDHCRNTVGFGLDAIEVLVMDEADRMLEDGFFTEVAEIVKMCGAGVGGKFRRQTVLFSATMTDKVDRLVAVSMTKPVRIFCGLGRVCGQVALEFVRVRNEAARDGMVLAILKRNVTGKVFILPNEYRLTHPNTVNHIFLFKGVLFSTLSYAEVSEVPSSVPTWQHEPRCSSPLAKSISNQRGPVSFGDRCGQPWFGHCRCLHGDQLRNANGKRKICASCWKDGEEWQEWLCDLFCW